MIIVQRWKGHIDFKEVQLCYSRFHSISKESEPELSSSLISRFSLVSLSPHIESPLHSARRILLIPSQLTRPVPQKESATTLVSVVIHRTRRMTTTVFLIIWFPFWMLLYLISDLDLKMRSWARHMKKRSNFMNKNCVFFKKILHLKTNPSADAKRIKNLEWP